MSNHINEGQISHSVKSFDRFEWTVDGFMKKSVDTHVESPGFAFEDGVWRLSVWFRGSEASSDITLNLWRTPSSGSRYAVRVGVKRKDGKDGLLVSRDTDSDGFLEVRKFVPCGELSKSNVKLLFPNGRLTVFCELCAPRKGGETSQLDDKPTSHLIQNLKDLFLGGQNSDVVINIEDEEIKAHRAILGARCPVFASMFQHDTQESRSGVVDIPDCTAEAFKVFLVYLYTGKVDGCSSDTVFSLYYAADKYDVQYLKKHCIKFMKDSLSVDNFCDIVALSLRHLESELLQKATSFFSQNVKVIIKTAQWQRFLTENPIQANELYIKALDA